MFTGSGRHCPGDDNIDLNMFDIGMIGNLGIRGAQICNREAVKVVVSDQPREMLDFPRRYPFRIADMRT